MIGYRERREVAEDSDDIWTSEKFVSYDDTELPTQAEIWTYFGDTSDSEGFFICTFCSGYIFFLEYDKSMKSSNSFRIPNLLQIRGTEKYHQDIFGQQSKSFDQNFRPAGIFNDRLSYESFSANNQTEKVRLEFSEVFGEPAWIIKSLKNDEIRFYSNEAVEKPVDVSIWMFLKSVDVDNSQRYRL